MDSLANAAARALSAGDPLGALKLVALRNDAAALALRGVALAQLGELAEARGLLRRAARAWSPRELLARARCTLAEAEVALAARELGGPSAAALEDALRLLEAHGDHDNARYARLLLARRALLLGRVEAAARALDALELQGAGPMTQAVAHLAAFDLAVRRGEPRAARVAVEHARDAAARAGIPALQVEAARAAHALDVPAARLLGRDGERPLRLEDVEAVRGAGGLVVDACRREAVAGSRRVALARRPVLFALLRALAEAWPGEASRATLLARGFGVRRGNASHRARLRVEVGRLRRELRGLADVHATPAGYALVAGSAVHVLAPPVEGADAEALALLADGQAWSTSALALALGASQRTAQRALAALAEAGRVRAVGRGRARRWVAPSASGFTPVLLLPAPRPLG